jgi:hypothetical protein
MFLTIMFLAYNLHLNIDLHTSNAITLPNRCRFRTLNCPLDELTSMVELNKQKVNKKLTPIFVLVD